jgi:predicted transcriptional regulator
MARKGVTRITADVPDEDVERLERIAQRIHSNKTTALVRALRTSALLEDAAASGSKIEIIDKDGTRREIVMP